MRPLAGLRHDARTAPTERRPGRRARSPQQLCGPACPRRTSSTGPWRAPPGAARSRSAWGLGAGNVRLTWSKTPLPALVNLDESRHAAVFSAVDEERVRLNDSAPTALERADGNQGPAARRRSGPSGVGDATAAARAAAFDQRLAP